MVNKCSYFISKFILINRTENTDNFLNILIINIRPIHCSLQPLINNTDYQTARDLAHDYYIEPSPQITQQKISFRHAS